MFSPFHLSPEATGGVTTDKNVSRRPTTPPEHIVGTAVATDSKYGARDAKEGTRCCITLRTVTMNSAVTARLKRPIEEVLLLGSGRKYRVLIVHGHFNYCSINKILRILTMVYNWFSGLCPSSGILNTENTLLRKLDLLPFSGEGRDTLKLSGPSIQNFRPWTKSRNPLILSDAILLNLRVLCGLR
jgi:hypothetical protein